MHGCIGVDRCKRSASENREQTERGVTTGGAVALRPRQFSAAGDFLPSIFRREVAAHQIELAQLLDERRATQAKQARGVSDHTL
jgi:hypothetical protein